MPLQKARLKISDYSANKNGKAKDHAKKVSAVSLSLTSMVDMFAILVIFLLANGNTVEEWVKLEHDIDLPKARTTDASKKATTLQVSDQAVYDENNNELVKVAQIRSGSAVVQPVAAWLKSLKNQEGYINLVADKDIPFGAMRRLITTCQATGFKNVNLAVFPR
jgi:biopolymer transport protein ExbD